MRVRGNISPEILTVEPYSPVPGKVEVRLRENIREIEIFNQTSGDFISMYEYDEYIFHLKYREGLKEDISKNMSDWLITGRTLEVNEGASQIQDMISALEILGVNTSEN